MCPHFIGAKHETTLPKFYPETIICSTGNASPKAPHKVLVTLRRLTAWHGVEKMVKQCWDSVGNMRSQKLKWIGKIVSIYILIMNIKHE